MIPNDNAPRTCPSCNDTYYQWQIADHAAPCKKCRGPHLTCQHDNA